MKNYQFTLPSSIVLSVLIALLLFLPLTSLKAGTLSENLKGKILLQVQSHGEAWYVNPKDGLRYYMANGNEAYNIMRNLGVGITNTDLDKIKTNKSFAKKNSGKILLQVQSHGEAYYIDFNGTGHYLKDGNAAYTIMRDLGLGITNDNLNQISSSQISQKNTGQNNTAETNNQNVSNNNTSPDFKKEAYEIMDTAIDNYNELLDFSNECASLAKQRIVVLQNLSSDRESWLEKVSFDSWLLAEETALYNLYDSEIALMREYQKYCEEDYPKVFNNNIKKINYAKLSLQQTSTPLPSSQLVEYQKAYLDIDKLTNSKNVIQDVIDKINSKIAKSDAVYRYGYSVVNQYIKNATTPTTLPSQYIAPTTISPQLPKTTYCTMRGDGVGLQVYMDCTTY